jgi:hypothetical protein
VKKIGILTILAFVPLICADQTTSCCENQSRSILVPRQLSYNPVFENALAFDARVHSDYCAAVCVKPLYTQTTGSTLQQYFNPDHLCALNVQEDGSGNISSLWMRVISSNDTFYSSCFSWSPQKQTYGALLYAAFKLPCDFAATITTAVVQTRNSMNICETGIENLGTCTCYETMTQAFCNTQLLYGRVCCTQKKAGLDDIQLKIIYQPSNVERVHFDVYGLIGIPTGKGSQARWLFEPLVGSKHTQLGLGATFSADIIITDCTVWALLAEAKYRYGLAGCERRSFDLTPNGQWSRYMLLVPETDPYAFYPAINTLTFTTRVTPRSSLDLYLALHTCYHEWQFEMGYDFWLRSAEKVALSCADLPVVGIADLKGIALQDPHTASTATICQAIEPGINQMTSDATFIPIKDSDINLASGAQPRSISNTIYASCGRMGEVACHPTQLGLTISYEHGSSINTPDNIALWITLDLYF